MHYADKRISSTWGPFILHAVYVILNGKTLYIHISNNLHVGTHHG